MHTDTKTPFQASPVSEISGEKYLWCYQQHDMQQVYQLAQRCNVGIPIVETLMSRGMHTEAAVHEFLYAPVERIVGDPLLLKDAEKAVARIERAIASGEKILIAGDYDVDGVTSSALLLACLLPLGADINFFLPHRQRDGYGLSVRTIQRAAANGYTLIITVDNGITAYEPALEAKRHGIDLIITDHHRPHQHLPEAYAIVDPYQEDCVYPFKYFAGVGVGFKLMSLLYQRCGKELPAKVYELLMLGTIADVVPLLGENRHWVRHGLQAVHNEESISFKVLKENARFVKPRVTSLDVGFYLAPQINALGRLDDARAAVKFLLGTDVEETARIGVQLAELNAARKQIEQGVVGDIQGAIQRGEIDLSTHAVLVASGENWPAGVIGLAASRLVGQYGRPAIVLHLTKGGIAKGSCRSIPEINMFELLQSVQDLLITFGGHPMAAGLSLSAEKIPQLRNRLHEIISEKIDIMKLRQRLYIDAELLLVDVNKKLATDIASLEPFGAGHREPLFRVSNVSLVGEPQLLKDLHVKIMIFSDGVAKPVIFFNRPELYPKLCAQGSEPFSIAVSLMENHWNGRVSYELNGSDVAGLVQ